MQLFRGSGRPHAGSAGSASFWRTASAIGRCDIRILARRPSFVAAAAVPALMFLLIELLGTAAVTSQPVALVVLDHGRAASVVRQLFHESRILRITDATPGDAKVLYSSVRVAAVVTVPADFGARVAAHVQAPIDVTLNNLNADGADDIRRSVADVTTRYSAAQGAPAVITVTTQETDLRHPDITLAQYEMVPMLVLILLITGLANTAVTAAREWETQRFKETLLSPASSAAIATGKVIAGFLLGCCAGVVELGIGFAMGWMRPEGWPSWGAALIVIGLVSLLAACLGLLIGVSFRGVQAAHTFAVSFSLYLSLLAGGIGVYAFEPGWLQRIGTLLPVTYANHALQMALFYHSTDQLGRDLAVLAVSSLLALVLCVRALGSTRGWARS